MLRRLALAALLALAPCAASAQFATIGPTPAVTDNGDRLATTAWVNNFFALGIPLASGKIFIGSAGGLATAKTMSGDCTLVASGVITCTQSAGAFTVNGLLTVTGNLSVAGSIIDGSGILATNIVAPATPAAGTTRIYVDSTQKVLTSKNDAGTVANVVVPSTASAHQWANAISAAGVISYAQPAFSDLSGQGTCPQEPALTGDITSSAGACATTLATVNANTGSWGTATQVSQFTVNAKGLITAAANVTVTPAIGSITGLGSGVGAALAINIGSAGAPVLFNGAGGTPTSLALTNATGLPLSTGVTGTLQAAQEPAHTGGCTNSAGSLALSCQINTNFPMGNAGNCGAIAANQTVFFGPNGCYNVSEVQVQSPVSAPFTLKNFYASSFQAPGGSQSYILTVRKNAVSTSITCTISAAATTCNDTTHTASFAAADLIDVQIVLSVSAAVAQPMTMATAVTTSP